MAESFRDRLFIFFLLIIGFCIATPAGIGIGIGLSYFQSDTFKLIQAFSLAIASGAFLHVSLFEILVGHKHSHETKNHDHQHDKSELCDKIVLCIRFGLFLIGFIAMGSLAVFD